MPTKTAKAPQAPRYPSAPSKAQLAELVDALGNIRDAALKLADSMRAKKKELESKIRAADAEGEEVMEYLKKHIERLGVGEVRGEAYRAWTAQNSRPSFELLCPAAELCDDLRKTKHSLDDAAALAAYSRGKLPEVITATLDSHARLEPV